MAHEETRHQRAQSLIRSESLDDLRAMTLLVLMMDLEE